MKYIRTILSILLCACLLTSCKVHTDQYITSSLDVICRGDYTEYSKLTGKTAAELTSEQKRFMEIQADRLLYALGGIMKGQFELFYQLVGNNGTLFNATDIFDTYVYRITTTQPLSMGLGTAAGLFQSLFGFILIMVTNMCIKYKNPEYALF